MLKNKKQIFLIISVLCLYITIAFRFSTLLNKEESFIDNEAWKIENLEVSVTEEYSLMLNYGDPFGTKPDKNTINRLSQKKPFEITRIRRRHKNNITNIIAKEVSLVGTINTQDNIYNRCILKLEEKEYVLRQGDYLQDLLVLEIFHDSIIIDHKGYEYHLKIK